MHVMYQICEFFKSMMTWIGKIRINLRGSKVQELLMHQPTLHKFILNGKMAGSNASRISFAWNRLNGDLGSSIASLSNDFYLHL
jgi:hypothetical protein